MIEVLRWFVPSCIPRQNSQERRGTACQNSKFFLFVFCFRSKRAERLRKSRKAKRSGQRTAIQLYISIQIHWQLHHLSAQPGTSANDNKPILPCFRDIMQPKTCTFKFLISFALILIKLSSLQELKNSELFFPPLKSMFSIWDFL